LRTLIMMLVHIQLFAKTRQIHHSLIIYQRLLDIIDQLGGK
jgi:hypothetical protein